MSRRKRKTPPARPASRTGRRVALVAAAVVLMAGTVAGFMALRGGESRRAASRGESPAAGRQGVAMAVADAPGLDRLKGRWVRPDGGYVLEITAIDAAGTIQAAYFNPRPINVAKAEATVSGTTLNVFVELRAPNYPGSTYTLTYDPGRDELAGVYYQAAMQQRFDVVFTRIK